MITRENYEIYFIDFIDGKLSDDNIELLHQFLDENPDLKEELEDIGSFKLEKPRIAFLNKESLKVSPELPIINLENFHDYLTKDLEEGLTENEYKALDNFSKNHSEIGVYIESNKNLILKPGTFSFNHKLELIQSGASHSIEELCLLAVE